MIKRTIHNNPYLLIEGTDQPQLDDEGSPIPDPTFGTVVEEELPDPPAPDPAPAPTKEELMAKVQELLTAIAALQG